MKRFVKVSTMLLMMLIATAITVSAQNPVTWKTSVKKVSSTEGIITVTGTIGSGWHLYGLTQPADGPQATKVTMTGTTGITFKGNLNYSPNPTSKMDEMFGAKVSYWEKKVTFTRRYKIKKGKTGTVTIKISYMCCNDSSCMPPRTDTLTVKIK